MRPLFENIEVGIYNSLKVQTFNHTKTCELTNWHIHPEYEMVYVKNGARSVQIAGQLFSYKSGTLLLLGPNIPHSDFGNKEHRDNLEVVIQFGQDFIDERLMSFPEFKSLKTFVEDSRKVLIFDKATKEKLSKQLEGLQHLNSTQRLLSFISILNLMEIGGKYSTLMPNGIQRKSKYQDIERLERAFEFVNVHYPEKINVSDMARISGLTENSFCRFFKKMTGRPFVDFLNEFRIRKAVELFDEKQRPVSEVMHRCGYNDPSYFTKQFKKYRGLTPTKYQSLILWYSAPMYEPK